MQPLFTAFQERKVNDWGWGWLKPSSALPGAALAGAQESMVRVVSVFTWPQLWPSCGAPHLLLVPGAEQAFPPPLCLEGWSMRVVQCVRVL